MPTLDWIGKAAVTGHHRSVPYHLLRCERELSAGDPGSGNLLIQGDNLLALKALLPYYAGQVKCIYIDPPYNTGNEKWVYNDAVNSPEIRKWLGKAVGAEAEDLSRHDKWLCMMYPRLALLKDFLAIDGVILISLDDNEAHHGRCLCDEILGARNFIGTFVWEGALKNDSRFISVSHDYVLCYGRSLDLLKDRRGRWRIKKEGIEDIYAAAEAIRRQCGDPAARNAALKRWYAQLDKTHPAWRHRHYNCIDEVGVYFRGDISWPGGGGPSYDILHPATGRPVAKPKRGWVFAKKETFLGQVRQNRVDFGPDEAQVPKLKRYLHETEDHVLPSVLYADRRAARQKLRAVMRGDVFDNPKDVDVLAMLLEAVADPNAMVLDSFAGSGSTAHAVLALNKSDGGNRRFILVEMEESIARSVTAQRLTKAIRGYTRQSAGGKAEEVPGLGGGFRYCTLGPPLFDAAGNIACEVSFPDLAAHVFFTETGSPIPARASGKTPLLGVHQGKAVYLLFNGVMGDRRPGGGNVLTHAVAHDLPGHPAAKGPRVVYGEACRLGPKSLDHYGITFRQIPYELKVD
ncbi:MAG: site-specific DNA-methyltransferase [Planctomycetes bacterium]|nr:site-specific DNA-methyltransferase [Planctomycetota bacterium]